MSLAATLTLNAYTGDTVPVSGALAPAANRWGSKGNLLRRQQTLAPADEALLADWEHPDVGWGLVLADRDDVSPADKARGLDAPAPVRDLLAARADAPVLRYRPDLDDEKLARYFEDGSRQDPEIGLSDFGVAKGRLPLYLLIVGSPGEVPWRLQFALNRRHHVGRLDLPEPGLRRYVDALLSGWEDQDSDVGHALVWSVGFDDITRTMDATVAKVVADAMGKDDELTVTRLEGPAATCQALVDALAAHRPSVVVSSSHGKTGPLGKTDEMRASLGLPVDDDRTTLVVETLLAAWQPAGAIWYAQACCSAGSNDGTSYDGLLEPGSLADQVTRAVGELGAAVAPLPTALLGAEKPLRAFVGHVEPTFDWTLVQQDTGQFLTAGLTEAWYPALYRRKPLGLALDEHYRGVGELYAKLTSALDDVALMKDGARDRATYFRLTATDRQGLVVLGDPTVMVPPLPSQRD